MTLLRIAKAIVVWTSDETFTDHLGITREVHRRNDITVNRAMFILGGYVFDQRPTRHE